eukprot:15457122-Alexandrium_andersonii.AAC.1
MVIASGATSQGATAVQPFQTASWRLVRRGRESTNPNHAPGPTPRGATTPRRVPPAQGHPGLALPA